MRLPDIGTRPQIISGKMFHTKVEGLTFMFCLVFFNLHSISRDFAALIQLLLGLGKGEGLSKAMEWFNKNLVVLFWLTIYPMKFLLGKRKNVKGNTPLKWLFRQRTSPLKIC